MVNLNLLLGLWCLIFAAYAVVAALRWNLARKEDDHLHMSDNERSLVSMQVAAAHKLDVLDRVKTMLLVLTVVFGLAVAALHLYSAWQSNSAVQY